MATRDRTYSKAILTITLIIILAGFIGVYSQFDPAAAQLGLNDKGFDSNALYTSGEILLKFKDNVDNSLAGKMIREKGLSIKSTSRFTPVMTVGVKPGNEERLAKWLQGQNLVEYAEPNYLAEALFVPDDKYYYRHWIVSGKMGRIDAENVWDISTGSGVIVAVLDTGVAYEDYRDSTGTDYYLAPNLASTSFVQGYDFVNDDGHPDDDRGYGTLVTGRIAQGKSNKAGVPGIAFNASIMPVKVLGDDGWGTYKDIADGIYFAVNNGAEVINLGLGGKSSSMTIRDAVKYAYENGVTVVAAAGNNGRSGNQPVYPAAYDDYVIAVGATDKYENLAPFSNTGSYIDVTALGNDPYNLQYKGESGTSMAAAHLSGVAALLISNGVTHPDKVREAIESTAKDLGAPGWDEKYGWGLVDAFAALNYFDSSPEPAHDISVSNLTVPSSVLTGELVSIDVLLENQGDFEETFVVTIRDATDGLEIGSDNVTLAVGTTIMLNLTWDTGSSSPGEHIITVEASQVSDESDTVDNVLSRAVTVKEPVHDVAVVSLEAPSSSLVGHLVSLEVGLENRGDFEETFVVTLRDVTDSVEISSYHVTLADHWTTMLSLTWDTGSSSPGEHMITAEVSQVSSELDTTDNSMTTTITLLLSSDLYKRNFLMGVGFWPTDYSPDYIDSNFKELQEGADMAYVQPEWTIESDSALNGIYDSWLERSRKEGLKTYIAIEALTGDRQGIRNPEGDPTITFADTTFRRNYRNQVLMIVGKQSPDYLNIGVEINMYLRSYPDDTENFISLYNEIYSEVKKVSPHTKVFVSFQYEVLRGEFLGISQEPQWDMLKMFEPLQDVIGISSYPGFGTTPYDPALIPEGYYDDLKEFSSRPLFFAEVGWYSSSTVSPASSENKQADFIVKLVRLIKPLSVEAVNWVGLRDPKDIPALAELKKQLPQFFSLGLLKSQGESKSTWAVWKSLK